jgi:hypothetical protein
MEYVSTKKYPKQYICKDFENMSLLMKLLRNSKQIAVVPIAFTVLVTLVPKTGNNL